MPKIPLKDKDGNTFNTATRQYVEGADTLNSQAVVPVDAAGVDLTETSVPDNTATGLKVRPIGEDIWVCSFARARTSIDSDYWTQRALGTGVTVSQASSNLLIATGMTANAEFLARSNVARRGSLILRYRFIASQRIANANCAVLLADRVGESLSCTINSATSITVALPGHGFTAENVGQYMCVGAITGAAGVPGRYAIASVVAGVSINFTVAGWPASGSCTLDLFGHSYVRSLYNGTTATSMAWDAQRHGWASGDTASTINTTASPGHLVQWINDGRALYLDDTLVASSATPNTTTRASRVENIPDDNLDLYIYLWSYNGTTAPASTTTWTFGFVALEKFANQPVFIAGNKAQGTRAPGPVQIVGTPTVSLSGTNSIGDVGVQYRATATGGASIAAVMSPVTPAATAAKAAAGRLLGWQLHNSGAALRSVKFWNTAVGSVTLGTTAALFEIDIPAGGTREFRLEGGIAFATALTYAVTGGKGLTDNTGALTANDVTGSLFYA